MVQEDFLYCRASVNRSNCKQSKECWDKPYDENSHCSLDDHSSNVRRIWRWRSEWTESEMNNETNYDYLQAIDWGVPALFAHPGSLRYGSSHRIIDWIDMRTWGNSGSVNTGIMASLSHAPARGSISRIPNQGLPTFPAMTSKPFHPII